MPTYVGAIDHGTTSSRFIIFDTDGNIVASHQYEFDQMFPQPGWHEQDPNAILSSVRECVDSAVRQFVGAGHSKHDIKAVGLTNQRETTLAFDIKTGEALYNAIAWPDTRTASLVREYKRKAGSEKLMEICGLPLSTYPSAVKLMWMLKNVDAVKKAYDAGTLAFATTDTWLLYHLSGGKDGGVFVTDSTNASRTMLMDLQTLQYAEEVLKFFELDRSKVNLPEIVPSASATKYGTFAAGELSGVKITGVLGDQHAALVGQKGFKPGAAKNTYGTGCFLVYNVGDKPVISRNGLLGTLAYDFRGVAGLEKATYALEGSIAVAGSAVKFLTNNFKFCSSSSEVTTLAESVEDNGGCYFVTAFSGLFAPYWIDDAKGTMFGITQYTQQGHVARAAMEASCYQTKAILDAMEKDSGHALAQLAVDGGMSNSDLCMQTQADIIQIPVDRPAMRETTCLGAAIAAGFAVGVWSSFEELSKINTSGRTLFTPGNREKGEKAYKVWSRAVEMCRGWTREDGEQDGEAVKSEESAAVKDAEAAQSTAESAKVDETKTNGAGLEELPKAGTDVKVEPAQSTGSGPTIESAKTEETTKTNDATLAELPKAGTDVTVVKDAESTQPTEPATADSAKTDDATLKELPKAGTDTTVSTTGEDSKTADPALDKIHTEHVEQVSEQENPAAAVASAA